MTAKYLNGQCDDSTLLVYNVFPVWSLKTILLLVFETEGKKTENKNTKTPSGLSSNLSTGIRNRHHSSCT